MKWHGNCFIPASRTRYISKKLIIFDIDLRLENKWRIRYSYNISVRAKTILERHHLVQKQTNFEFPAICHLPNRRVKECGNFKPNIIFDQMYIVVSFSYCVHLKSHWLCLSFLWEIKSYANRKHNFWWKKKI